MTEHSTVPLFTTFKDLTAHLDTIAAQVTFTVEPISRTELLLDKFGWKIETIREILSSPWFKVVWVKCSINAPWLTRVWHQPLFDEPDGDAGLVFDPEGNVVLQIMVETSTYGRGWRGGSISLGPTYQSGRGNREKRATQGLSPLPFSSLAASSQVSRDPTIVAWGKTCGVGGRIATTTHLSAAIMPLERIEQEAWSGTRQEGQRYLRVSLDIYRRLMSVSNDHLRGALELALHHPSLAARWALSFNAVEEPTNDTLQQQHLGLAPAIHLIPTFGPPPDQELP